MWKVIAMPEDTTIILFETNDKEIAENILEQWMNSYKESDIAFALYNNGTYYPATL